MGIHLLRREKGGKFQKIEPVIHSGLRSCEFRKIVRDLRAPQRVGVPSRHQRKCPEDERIARCHDRASRSSGAMGKRRDLSPLPCENDQSFIIFSYGLRKKHNPGKFYRLHNILTLTDPIASILYVFPNCDFSDCVFFQFS